MIILTFLALFSCTQAAVWDNLTANLAVVEYQPVYRDDSGAQASVLLNTIQYMEHVVSLSVDKKFDLIVFPESTLQSNTQTAVEVTLNTTCETKNCPDPLAEIAFISRTYQTYIVINLVEKSKCEASDQTPNCKNFGFHFYNTDVVFDRSGKIINKYRKYNLFGERSLDRPDTAEQVIIRTDFGVNFGIFTCFDIMFKSPAQDLLAQDVNGIIFPTMWFSELPFLTAVQTQQMWAQRHDVLFLAAGANSPIIGSGGSGFYRGAQGAALSGYVAEGGSHPLVYTSKNGQIPPSPTPDVDKVAKSMDGFFLKTDPSVKDYTSEPLDTSVGVVEKQLCHKDLLCCNFNIKMGQSPTDGNSYKYLLVAYSGVRSYSGVYNGGVELCAVLACIDSTLASCGKRFPNYDEVHWPVTFKEITIVANFEKNENKTQFPNSLLSSILPIEAGKTLWKQEEKGDLVETTFSTTQEQNRLLTFGIWGRNFGLDSPPDDEGVNGGRGSGGMLEGAQKLILGGLITAAFLMG